ncbi:hypothetical protein RHSIM_Rhsim09G0092700 [Rhododendron simsii]|uniref:Transposase n=1 Tax=Rhododendron simsii TaxID=118357 RepID=A0A834GJK0_RHOSS|nr:hypothetical protein RHSIM_Rhsim09G0092700 [Rhododendron simsii]
MDNTKYNDGLVDVLKCHILLSNSLSCDGQFFHIRCGAHVLNLIVQEGLKVIEEAIHSVRESVKYVRGSEARKIKFAQCLAQLPSSCSKKVRQDIVTRWNSTYSMLESALVRRLAYYRLQLVNTNFRTCPSEEEWERVERITRFLKPFFEINALFFGSRYPTVNLYFHGVWKIQLLIKEEMENLDDVISSMARRMKGKFDKYWECYSMVLSLAIILDPRYKVQFVEFCLKKLDLVNFSDRVKSIREKLYLLFEDYVSRSPASTFNQSSSSHTTSGGNQNDVLDVLDEFDVFESQECGLSRVKSELDLYLEEPRLDRKKNVDLDILCYWKSNTSKYPNLSFMARDILRNPITTVASESAFSIGGRIIEKYRSSLIPKNVEALLCTRDWQYNANSRVLITRHNPKLIQVSTPGGTFGRELKRVKARDISQGREMSGASIGRLA